MPDWKGIWRYSGADALWMSFKYPIIIGGALLFGWWLGS